jgi:hypothetical protein
MRTTLILRDDLIKEAMDLTNATEKTAVVHMGLEALIEKKAREKLIELGGVDKKARSGKRRKNRVSR